MAYYPIAPGTLNSNQSSSQLVRTSTGNLYAILVVNGNLTVWLSVNRGTSWVQQDYSNSPSCGAAVAAAIDSTDKIHIAYNSGNTLQYISFSSTTNTFGRIEVLGGGLALETLAIAVDANNIPHVVLGRAGASPAATYFNRLIGTWNSVSLSSNSYSNFDIQINNNVPVISGLISATSVDVYIGNQNNARSFTSHSLNTPLPSNGASLAIDSLGNTWVGFTGPTGRVVLANQISTNAWATWQTSKDNGENGIYVSLAVDGTDIYVFYEKITGGLAYDCYHSAQGYWLGEQIIQPNTSTLTTNQSFHHPFVKWSTYFDNGLTGANNQNQNIIEYLFDNGSTIYYSKLDTGQISTNLVNFTFQVPPPAFTTSTSSTSTSTSVSSTSSSTSISSTSSSTSTTLIDLGFKPRGIINPVHRGTSINSLDPIPGNVKKRFL